MGPCGGCGRRHYSTRSFHFVLGSSDSIRLIIWAQDAGAFVEKRSNIVLHLATNMMAHLAPHLISSSVIVATKSTRTGRRAAEAMAEASAEACGLEIMPHDDTRHVHCEPIPASRATRSTGATLS
jgi:hypothetical protein